MVLHNHSYRKMYWFPGFVRCIGCKLYCLPGFAQPFKQPKRLVPNQLSVVQFNRCSSCSRACTCLVASRHPESLGWTGNARERFLYGRPGGPNPLYHRHDFSGPALRHGDLNSLCRAGNEKAGVWMHTGRLIEKNTHKQTKKEQTMKGIVAACRDDVDRSA